MTEVGQREEKSPLGRQLWLGYSREGPQRVSKAPASERSWPRPEEDPPAQDSTVAPGVTNTHLRPSPCMEGLSSSMHCLRIGSLVILRQDGDYLGESPGRRGCRHALCKHQSGPVCVVFSLCLYQIPRFSPKKLTIIGVGVRSANQGGLASREKDPMSVTGLEYANVPSHQKGVKEQGAWWGPAKHSSPQPWSQTARGRGVPALPDRRASQGRLEIWIFTQHNNTNTDWVLPCASSVLKLS